MKREELFLYHNSPIIIQKIADDSFTICLIQKIANDSFTICLIQKIADDSFTNCFPNSF